MTESLNQWILPAYGAPDGSSEVNRNAGFYRLEALAAFGAPPLASEALPAKPEPTIGVAAALRAAASGLLPQSPAVPRPA